MNITKIHNKVAGFSAASVKPDGTEAISHHITNILFDITYRLTQNTLENVLGTGLKEQG